MSIIIWIASVMSSVASPAENEIFSALRKMTIFLGNPLRISATDDIMISIDNRGSLWKSPKKAKKVQKM